MKAREIIQSAVETIVPPSAAEIRHRLEAARTALVAAQGSDTAAQAALDACYGADDAQALLKAEADAVQARLALGRAAGRVQALERQLIAAEAAQAAGELEAGRRNLAGLKADRQRHGEQILAALDRLQAAVTAFVATDEAVMALPSSVRGTDAAPGFLLGAGPLQAHLSIELEQRGITGSPSSLDRPRLADWLATGSRTLAS